MLLDETRRLLNSLLGQDLNGTLPPLLLTFLEASKTSPSGIYRPYMALSRYWAIAPPRNGIIEGEQVKWRDNLKEQIGTLETLQSGLDSLLPHTETIPPGWAVNLPTLGAFVV